MPEGEDKDSFKLSLPSLSPCAVFDTYRATEVSDKMIQAGYSEKDISFHHNGNFVGDIDHLESIEQSEWIKGMLLEALPCILSIFISPSGLGLKIIFKGPVVETPEQYTAVWAAIMDDLRTTLHSITDKGKVPEACKETQALAGLHLYHTTPKLLSGKWIQMMCIFSHHHKRMLRCPPPPMMVKHQGKNISGHG